MFSPNAASGNVVVVNYGGIISNSPTTGNAESLVAQALGGSGGNGGFAVPGSVSNGDLSLAVGGGGAGGTAGAVFNEGVIQTVGPLSASLAAQSLCGAGGVGGGSLVGGVASDTSLGVNVGGIAGGVDVYTTSISTAGDQSPGIVAQAIGGAGGSGGWDVAGTIGSSVSANLTTGDTGGAGGMVIFVSTKPAAAQM
ncbi:MULTISPECIES: hypothetical protein [unclassified Xanthobacter]|uniref:hypothetical protein n=1 Tax=unclassified Xanthobacter TaxID=2623496 RepID=UPI001F27AEBF|nr:MULTISPECIES: hypothetical protein [unclassified Xanthobacter]